VPGVSIGAAAVDTAGALRFEPPYRRQQR
jgi:hypothetical protein